MAELEAQLSRPPPPPPTANEAGEEGIGAAHVGSRAQLTLAQFELVVELMDEALRQDAAGIDSGAGGGPGAAGGNGPGDGGDAGSRYGTEDSGIAMAVIRLAVQFNHQVNAFKYYAYMCEDLQKHDVWRSSSFWEAFFHRVSS